MTQTPFRRLQSRHTECCGRIGLQFCSRASPQTCTRLMGQPRTISGPPACWRSAWPWADNPGDFRVLVDIPGISAASAKFPQHLDAHPPWRRFGATRKSAWPPYLLDPIDLFRCGDRPFHQATSYGPGSARRRPPETGQPPPTRAMRSSSMLSSCNWQPSAGGELEDRNRAGSGHQKSS